jgi:phage terminase small subunit
MSLTKFQKRVADEYLVDLNATRAYIRAKGRSKAPGQAASELLKNPEVRRYVQQRIEERAARTEITQDLVLRELLAIARSDVAQLVDADGNMLPIHEMPESARRAVSGIEVTPGGQTKARLWRKDRALELLGRHLRLWSDDQTAQRVTLVVRMDGSREGDDAADDGS